MVLFSFKLLVAALVIASTKKAASEPKNLSTNNSILIFLGLRVLNNAMASSASPFITLLSRFKLMAVFRRDTKSKLRIKSIS